MREPIVAAIGTLLAMALAGCSSPCAQGFEKDTVGICRAVATCKPGTQRSRNLTCEPHSASENSATDTAHTQQHDTGAEEPDSLTDDTDSSGDGPGRILVKYEQLEGAPAHAFLVLAEIPGFPEHIATFCEIILTDPMSIEGYLVPHDGSTDPCPSAGEPKLFAAGQVSLIMSVAQGPDSPPAFCDERVVEVSGDHVVDFSEVTGCDP
jgi:hypothetical protein